MEDYKMKFVFFGTPEFGAIVLEQLLKHGLQPFLVVSAPDKPVGRKQELTFSAVKVSALNNDIPLLQPDNLSDDIIEKLQADLFVVAAYGKILPKSFLDIPRKGVLNVHPSLLPKYRGPSPVHASILNGDKETGVSIMLLDEKMDHGSILSQEIYKEDLDSITTPELTKELALAGGKLLSKTIGEWMNNDVISSLQDDTKATYTKIIRKENGHIDWNKNAVYIVRQVRAYIEWPGAYTFVEDSKGNSLRLKIIRASFENTSKGKPGLVYSHQDGMAVQTSSGLLVIHEIQIEGKSAIETKDFIRGYPWIIGKILK